MSPSLKKTTIKKTHIEKLFELKGKDINGGFS